ncbi:MAG: hypothetical protein AVDCRST_MAG19-602, partial [uncultured Thermomicrobiales bacterium]
WSGSATARSDPESRARSPGPPSSGCSPASIGPSSCSGVTPVAARRSIRPAPAEAPQR